MHVLRGGDGHEEAVFHFIFLGLGHRPPLLASTGMLFQATPLVGNAALTAIDPAGVNASLMEVTPGGADLTPLPGRARP